MQMTVGTLARETGVTVATLRTWATRYDFPPSKRSEGGHRLYEPSAVEMVRSARRALATGRRPKEVMRAVPSGTPEKLAIDTTPGAQIDSSLVSTWLGAAARFDRLALDTSMRRAIAKFGLRSTVVEIVPAFLVALGKSWEADEIDVAHEHFASGTVEIVLGQSWMSLVPASGPTAVLATLPGEEHGLVLHILACVLVQAGYRVTYLGVNCPPAAVISAVVACGASLLAISAPYSSPSGLDALQTALPPGVKLVVGGNAAPESFRSELSEFISLVESRI